MNNQDIKELDTLKNNLEKEGNKEVKPLDAVALIEQSLFEFLEFRLQQLKKDIEFQDEIKKYLLARLPEAEFTDLRFLLEQEQRNTISSAQSILNPFIPRVQEIDKNKHKVKQVEEEIFENGNKDNLQSIQEMFQLFSQIKKEINNSKNTNIKKALEESLNEAEKPINGDEESSS